MAYHDKTLNTPEVIVHGFNNFFSSGFRQHETAQLQESITPVMHIDIPKICNKTISANHMIPSFIINDCAVC